jgi:hypothetical protein
MKDIWNFLQCFVFFLLIPWFLAEPQRVEQKVSGMHRVGAGEQL